MNIKPRILITAPSLRQILILIIGLFSLLIFVFPVQAQTPTPRDELIIAIQERAQQDVKLGKPPASIEGLNILFGEQAKTSGISMTEVLSIYEEAYTVATPPKSWMDSLKPEYGWFVAAFLFVLFILRDIIKDNITKFFNWLGKNIYKHVAGFRPFWWLALRRYRRALVKKYEELNIPFRPGRPLRMHEIYVPIKVAGTSDADLLDARQALLEHQWLVVVGSPGSGKSMLLKNLALTYAQGELVNLPTQPIPIYLELNRMNESNAQLRDHLVEILDQNDFPNASGFLEAGLTHGLLMLMFDGLDEVNTDLRESVVNKIKDLISKFPNCRAVVTCRSAVYNDEFADLADQKLEIVEFSDQQIQRFLLSWSADMPSDKSVDHLLRNLSERPRIMALARNPLLLTIIAYLYTDTEFVLPHSRAEFYDKSVTVLLEQWKEKRNRYKAAHKKLVLQHLALFNQDSSVEGGQDRRSIDLPTTLTEIKKVLPSLTLKDDDVQPILDEIVERSGLMIEIDGGTKYQFTHLTLQEFFAALALEADVSGLARRYDADKDAWRETVKLWCGLTHNSTQLIRSIYSKDPIMAFECLGDAQQIDADFSEEISDSFKVRLGEPGDSGEAIIRAFAVVAADPRPRGQKVFDFLVSALNDQRAKDQQSLAAAKSLSLTNLLPAAEALAKYAVELSEIRPLLIQMGDLAVPILGKWVIKENEWVLDALHTIGTPQAARVLVPLLWDKTKVLQYQSAWRLSSILSKPNVEMVLREFSLTTDQRNTEQLNWVWEPFEGSATSPLRIIVGRIAHLLFTASENTLPNDSTIIPNARIVIPLCTIESRFSKYGHISYEDRLQFLQRAAQGSSDLDAKKRIILEYRNKISEDRVWRYLFNTLPATSQFDMLGCLINASPLPNEDDWRNIFQPLSYVFESSWHARITRLLLTLLVLSNLWVLVPSIIRQPQFMSWENVLPIISGLAIIVLFWFLWRSKQDSVADAEQILGFLALGFGSALSIVIWKLSGNWFLGITSLIITYIVIYFFMFGKDLDIENIGVLGGIGLTAITIIGGDIVAGIAGNSLINIMSSIIIGAIGIVIVDLFINEHKIGTLLAGIVGGVLGSIFPLILGIPFGYIYAVIGGCIGGILGITYITWENRNAFILILGVGGCSVILDSLFMFFPTDLVYKIWDGYIVVVIWLVYVISIALIIKHASRQERRAQNPLHSLLKEIDTVVTPRTLRPQPLKYYLRLMWR